MKKLLALLSLFSLTANAQFSLGDFSVGIFGNLNGVAVVPFVANTAVYDNVNDSALYNAGAVFTDGKTFTVSFWYNPSGSDGVSHHIFAVVSVSTPRFIIWRNTDNKLYFQGYNSAATLILNINTAATFLAAGGWYHIYCVCDMANASATKIYVNGSADSYTSSTFSNDTIDLSPVSPGCYMGRNTSRINGAMAEFWIAQTLLDDPTKFNSGGHPISLGTTGELPTGTAPKLYFSLNGDGNNWLVDSSHAKTFTLTGSLGTTTPP